MVRDNEIYNHADFGLIFTKEMKDGKVLELSTKKEKTIDENDIPKIGIVPLTKEWLLYFDFEKIEDGKFIKHTKDENGEKAFFIAAEINENKWLFMYSSDGKSYMGIGNYESVNQLQSVYHRMFRHYLDTRKDIHDGLLPNLPTTTI